MIFKFNINYKISEVFENINEEEVYSYYLKTGIQLNKLYNCPFHEDSTPSFGFYTSRNSKYLRYKCFGCEASGNVFEFIKTIENIEDISELSKFIVDNFGSTAYGKKTITDRINNNLNFPKHSYGKHSKVIINPIFRNWNYNDFLYWNSYGIDFLTLDHFKVKPCSTVYVTSKSGKYFQHAINSRINPIYHYNTGGNSTIYRPLSSKNFKWFKNCDSWDIYGLEQLPLKNDTTIITSSLKDVMVLYKFGYNAIAPMGEGIHIPEKIMDYVFAVSKEVIVFYDHDDQGLKMSSYMEDKYGIRSITTGDSEAKDISDYYKLRGEHNTSTLLKSIIMGE